MIRLALRFDDPSATSNHTLEAAIFQELGHQGFAATVAAIPYRRQGEAYVALGPENAAHMVEACQAGVIEIAQHGYSHEERGQTMGGAPSEFCGVPENQQRDLIQAGKALLQDVFSLPITGFVPPWNTHDNTTVSVLQQAGFRYLSAGDTPSAELVDVTFLPRSCQLVDIVSAVKDARRFSWLSPVVIGVMHHYDFRESGSEQARISLTEFAGLLAWIAGQQDVSTSTLGMLCTVRPRFTHLSRLDVLRRILPWRLGRWLPEGCLLPIPNSPLSHD